MNIARISALQLALVWLLGRGGLASGGRDLPALGALVQEVGAALGELRQGVPHAHAPDGDGAALGKVELEDRLVARLLLLLLELRRGLLAQLLAGRLAVVGLERGVEALRHGGGVPLAVGRAARGRRR